MQFMNAFDLVASFEKNDCPRDKFSIHYIMIFHFPNQYRTIDLIDAELLTCSFDDFHEIWTCSSSIHLLLLILIPFGNLYFDLSNNYHSYSRKHKFDKL